VHVLPGIRREDELLRVRVGVRVLVGLRRLDQDLVASLVAADLGAFCVV
jgi:hypothetical protein